jgi:quercetin dioxygenase-like cupin family protein
MDLVCGNIFVRQMTFGSVGDVVEGHEHNFDHTTYVPRGALMFERLRADGSVEKTITKRATDGYNWVLIRAGVRHRITALEEGSIGHCIYAHRNAQGDIVQDYDGWTPAYR